MKNCFKQKSTISKIESANFEQAKAIQIELATKVALADSFSSIKTVAGADVGLRNNNQTAIGGVVVLSYPDLEVVEKSTAKRDIVFPYVPGFLSFREVPVLLEAYSQLTVKPDLLLCDGQGIAHPRRFGLACHLGIVLDLPAIGVAKTRLIGTYEEPGLSKGCTTPLNYKDEQIGTVVRTRKSTKPLFISPGHKISIKSAQQWALNCCTKYRLPETTRQSHKLVSG